MSTATLEKNAATSKKTQVYYTRCLLCRPIRVWPISSVIWMRSWPPSTPPRFGRRSSVLDPKVKPDPGDPYSLRHAGHIKALWARAEGADSRLISLSWLEGSYPTYVLDQKIASVADLKGKKLAVVKFGDADTIDLLRAQQLRIFDSTLTTAALSLRDVKLVDVHADKSWLKPKTEPASPAMFSVPLNRALVIKLIRGEVDAITAQIPAELVNFLGLHLVHDTRRNQGKSSRANPSVLRGVVASAGLLRENRDLVVRILARHLEAAEWAKKNPDETVSLLAKDLNVPESVLRSRYENLADGTAGRPRGREDRRARRPEGILPAKSLHRPRYRHRRVGRQIGARRRPRTHQSTPRKIICPPIPSSKRRTSAAARHDEPAWDPIQIARDLAREFEKTVVERDRANERPFAELKKLRETRLVNLLIPKTLGGEGGSVHDSAHVILELAKGDGSLAAILAFHFYNSQMARYLDPKGDGADVQASPRRTAGSGATRRNT